MNLKNEVVLLDLIRDCINNNQSDYAISIIKEKQNKSNVDYSLILKHLFDDKQLDALSEVNKLLKENGLKNSEQIILSVN